MPQQTPTHLVWISQQRARHLASHAPGCGWRLLADLRESVSNTRDAEGETSTGAAPMDRMVATFPARAAVGEMISRYMDRLYEVDDE